jgi:MFS family permease
MTRPDADPEIPEHWLAALQYRDFRLLLIGEVTSAIGTEMFYVALNWQMYLLTHSALSLGLLGLAGFIPAMLFSLLGGNFADAHNRKKILYITQPIFMLCSILLALATFTHVVTPLIMYIIAGIVAATVAFDHPARSSLIPNLVDKKDFTHTLSVYEMFEQTARITGPLIAGFLIAGVGVGSIYGIDAISTIAVLLALLLMKHTGDPGGEKSVVSLNSIKEGLTFVRSNTLLWSTILVDFFATFLALAMVLLPIFANDILHVGPHRDDLLDGWSPTGRVRSGIAGCSYRRATFSRHGWNCDNCICRDHSTFGSCIEKASGSQLYLNSFRNKYLDTPPGTNAQNCAINKEYLIEYICISILKEGENHVWSLLTTCRYQHCCSAFWCASNSRNFTALQCRANTRSCLHYE